MTEIINGITFSDEMTMTIRIPKAVIIPNIITIEELGRYLERKENRLFDRQMKVETRNEIERFKHIEERLSDKTHLLDLIIDLAIKEENEGLTEEEKRLNEILTKLYLILT